MRQLLTRFSSMVTNSEPAVLMLLFMVVWTPAPADLGQRTLNWRDSSCRSVRQTDSYTQPYLPDLPAGSGQWHMTIIWDGMQAAFWTTPMA